jgi:hypothetical protein
MSGAEDEGWEDILIDSSECSENKDSDHSFIHSDPEDKHLDTTEVEERFHEALRVLVGKTYSNNDVAEGALVKFMNQGFSSMHYKGSFKAKKGEISETTMYRCGVTWKCPFRIKKVQSKQGSWTFTAYRSSHHTGSL